MANYNTTSGGWLDVNDELDGKKLKFVNECVPTPSDKFKNEDGTPKMTNLVKVRVQGADESVNMRPNWTSVSALVEAFGSDSKAWIGKILTVRVKDATTGQSAYLLPDGFELYRNEEKRWAIRRTQEAAQTHIAPVPETPRVPAEKFGDMTTVEYPTEDINPEDIPF